MTKLYNLIIKVISAVTLTAVLSACHSNGQYKKEAAYLYTPENRALLSELDSLLSTSDVYVKEKEARIARIRADFNRIGDMERRYWLAEGLYDEYSAYDSDSALHYANVALDYARMMGRKDLAAEMQLNCSYVFSATGLLDQASNCLTSMDPDSLPPELAVKYCDRMLFLQTHRDQYIGTERNISVYSMMTDSLLQSMSKHVKPGDVQYCWLIGWSGMKNRKDALRAIKAVSPIVDSTDFSTRGNAMDAWVLSKLYETTGNEPARFKYLILSAMADVRASNKEIASLQEIAGILYNNGDLDRANSYITHSITYAGEYKSRVCIGQLAALQKQILTAIQERGEHQAAVIRWYLLGLVFILCGLILATFYILRQNRLLRQSRETLNVTNSKLNEKVAELSALHESLNKTNAELSAMYDKVSATAGELARVNKTKENYIADVFAICSTYIDKISDFRAKIHKLLSSRRFEDAARLAMSPELSYTEVKELCANFDRLFLGLFPDFVEQINTLLTEENRITLRNPDKLTSELRIFALVRLGMNDSRRIALFLHCSVQTVYNARQRMRNKARVPRDEFANYVMSLGNPAANAAK